MCVCVCVGGCMQSRARLGGGGDHFQTYAICLTSSVNGTNKTTTQIVNTAILSRFADSNKISEDSPTESLNKEREFSLQDSSDVIARPLGVYLFY